MASPPTAARPTLRRRAHPRRLLLLVVLVTLGIVPVADALAVDGDGPRLEIVEAHGIIDATLAGHLVDVIETANEAGAEAVVIEVDSPGALGDAAARVVDAIESSDVPIVSWVGPPGVRASAGAVAVAQAAHVLGAAPGTLIGPGSPVDLAVHPAAGLTEAEALLTRLAEERGRDVEAARGLAAGRVLAVGPPGDPDAALPDDARLPDGVARGDVDVRSAAALVDAGALDVHAPSLSELLAGLDAREVTVRGTVRTLDVDNAAAVVRFNNLGLVGQVLHSLTSPALVYLLVVGGALALLFEVFQPGFGVAGSAGLAVLALGAYGLVVLPASLFGAALLAVGLLLLAADLALARLGVLTAVGAVAVGAGSVTLFTGPPTLQVSLWLAGFGTVTAVVFFVGIMTTVLRAQSANARAGTEHLVGESGVVRSVLNPEGHVFVKGALWRARAPEDAGLVKTGTPVRVVGLNDRLTLDVELVEAEAEPSESSTV